MRRPTLTTTIRLNRAFVFLAASCVPLMAVTARATTIADWTFETTPPASSGPITADSGVNAGTAQATGSHVGTSTYSSPAGNGSAHSYSSTNWAVGDYYQFEASTTSYSNIEFMWDQTSSNTGPGQFQLEYSTDGTSFTNFGSAYTVLANAAPNPVWNTSTTSTGYTTTDNLSSISALNNASTVYFRLVDHSTTSANGGTVGSAGTDRVDNVIIETVPSLALLGLSVSTGALNDNLLKGAPASDFTGTATVTNTGPVAGNYSASSPDASLTLTGVGSSVAANSSATFGYGLSTIPTAYGDYTGNLTVTPSGTSNDAALTTAITYYVGNPAADNSNSATTFGPYTYIAHIASGGSFAGLSSKVSFVSGTGGAGALDSEAIIRYGSNNSAGTETLGEDWRTRTQTELTAGLVDSDVLKLTGIPIGTLYVLQISYDPNNTSPYQGIAQYISGNWVNAAAENYSGGTDDVGSVAWNSSYETLGDYGFDPSSHVAWTVLDHGGTFAVSTSSVPEPAPASLLAIGSLTLLRRSRRSVRATKPGREAFHR